MPAIEDRLKALGITLPTPVPPVANYVPFVISGHQLVVSGQICAGLDGKVAERHQGNVGGGVSQEAGKEAVGKDAGGKDAAKPGEKAADKPAEKAAPAESAKKPAGPGLSKRGAASTPTKSSPKKTVKKPAAKARRRG